MMPQLDFICCFGYVATSEEQVQLEMNNTSDIDLIIDMHSWVTHADVYNIWQVNEKLWYAGYDRHWQTKMIGFGHS